MKVLFINTVFGRGSTGKIVKDIGDAILEQGGDYVAAYGEGISPDEAHSYFIGTRWNRKIHAGLSRITDRAGFYSKKPTKKLVKFIREYQPDVINLHNLHGYYINLPVLFEYLKNEYKGKIVWTLHDCWAFTGHCPHYTYVNCDKWQSECSNCPEKKRYPKSLLLDNSKKNYIEKRKLFSGLKNLTIVTPSRWLSAQVEKSFLKDYPRAVINNGIDLELFVADERQKTDKATKMLLNVADGLDERKGYKDLIRLKELLGDEYEIVIVGAKEEGEDVRESGITVIQRTESQKELIKYYQKATYFVNPTYEDNFPTVNIEALACGTPVITYNSGGSAEIIDENTGFAVTPGDIEAVISILKSQNPPSGDNCRNRALLFDKKEMCKKYLELFNS